MAENIDEIISKIKNNSNEENKKLAEELKNGLSESQSRSLQQLLSNKELVKKILDSDQAKNLIKKFGGDKHGHQ